MTTLITVQKSDGTLIGRCDARCHNAKSPRCVCVCGGANHGKGAGSNELTNNPAPDFKNDDFIVTCNPIQYNLLKNGQDP